jgi:hypothetical protein
MPAFTFTSPEGKSYTVNGPDGATQEQAFQILQQQIGTPTFNKAGIGGVGSEISRAANENLDAIKSAGPSAGLQRKAGIGGLLDTGSALAAIPGLLASPITGAARSLIGRGYEAATNAIAPLSDEQRNQYGLASGRDVADKAIMGIAPRGYSPIGPRLAPPATPSAIDLKAAAKSVYNDPLIKSISIQPSDVARLAQDTSQYLTAQGFRRSPGNAPGTLSELDRLSPTSGAPLSVDDLRASRRALSITAKQIDPATFQPTPDAAAARQAIEQIDGFLDKLNPSLKQANANYAAGKSADRLDYRTIKADRRAAKSGSGMNIENTIRQEVDKIPNRGLTPDQIAQRDAIVLGTPARNALRTAGKLGVDGGLSLMLHGGAAIGTGGTTLPVTIGGTIARKAGEHLTRNAIAALSESIRANSPLARSLAPAPLPAPNPFLAAPASGLSLAELLSGLRAYPALVPSRAERERN